MNKDEIKKLAFKSYKRGKVDSLHSLIAGLSVLIGKQVEPPITVYDIVKLVKGWLKEAEEELKEEG
jgi:hypothetical protein